MALTGGTGLLKEGTGCLRLVLSRGIFVRLFFYSYAFWAEVPQPFTWNGVVLGKWCNAHNRSCDEVQCKHFTCTCFVGFSYTAQIELEQLERLRSEDTPRHLMITHTIESCWIPRQNKVEWPWRYRSRSKVITCNTPSHASYHLYQIWKESIQNYRRYRADTNFKVKAEWPWKYRSKSNVITCDTPLMLMMICAKYG